MSQHSRSVLSNRNVKSPLDEGKEKKAVMEQVQLSLRWIGRRIEIIKLRKSLHFVFSHENIFKEIY
jgi:hypothetical protein